jgi:hypothetical protein
MIFTHLLKKSLSELEVRFNITSITKLGWFFLSESFPIFKGGVSFSPGRSIMRPKRYIVWSKNEIDLKTHSRRNGI